MHDGGIQKQTSLHFSDCFAFSVACQYDNGSATCKNCSCVFKLLALSHENCENKKFGWLPDPINALLMRDKHPALMNTAFFASCMSQLARDMGSH